MGSNMSWKKTVCDILGKKMLKSNVFCLEEKKKFAWEENNTPPPPGNKLSAPHPYDMSNCLGHCVHLY